VTVGSGRRQRDHILLDLGFDLKRVGEQLCGSAVVFPEMWVPGTEALRTSILATWTDVAAGMLAVDAVAPRVPVTLELDVHLYRQAPAAGTVRTVSRVVKAGRSVVVLAVDFTDGEGEPVAVGNASFMAAPDPGLTLPPRTITLEAMPPGGSRLAVPFAERARCERREPGVALLHRSDDGMNSSKSVQGGLVSLVVEEAALSLTPGASLSSMALRYLRAVRVGPALASAAVRGGLGRVEVRDAGSDDRLAAVATTRTFPA
jgi:acyl-coenzyme A thioesterase PaaI-like protein